EMKIRVGITAPILPDDAGDRGTVALPVLLSQNFDAAEPAWVWIEPRSAIAPLRLRTGERATVQLGNVSLTPAWAPESEGKAGIQRFAERTVEPPKRITVVVDASESMRAKQKEIRDALGTIPKTIDAKVVEVGSWRGGVDAVPALEEALPGTV